MWGGAAWMRCNKRPLPSPALPPPPQDVQPGLGLRLRLALANPAVRLLLTSGTLVAALGAMYALQAAGGGGGGEPVDRALQLRQGLLALAGYSCNKLALLGVAGGAAGEREVRTSPSAPSSGDGSRVE